MSWKNVKEHYGIVHQVQVTDDGICIGSPYVHNIIVIDGEGRIAKEDDRTLNQDLQRYLSDMKADPDKLKQLIDAPDIFAASLPVFTYKGAEIIEKQCEQLGWPNVTHDGQMMYQNMFFADRESALAAARTNCEAAIMLRRMELADQRERLDRIAARLDQLLADAEKLGITTTTPSTSDDDVERCPICDEPFKPEDTCATDITEGPCHAACLEGSPVVDLDTGNELPPGELDTYPHSDVSKQATGATEKTGAA